jgi:Tat protein secretion system quality control protein TatD with DNase activity
LSHQCAWFSTITGKAIDMAEGDDDNDAFWQIGVFDAHCHPTDIMATTKDIPNMKARFLTVMATRSQDQELVVELATKYPTEKDQELSEKSSSHVVPAFGWHPWFSHQIYDDRDNEEVEAGQHYKSVLAPTPDDAEFLGGLPTPKSLTQYLKETEARLRRFPLALVGEVGLDKPFRVPTGSTGTAEDRSKKSGGSTEEYTGGSREGRPLSPYRVSMDHQKTILRAQLDLAAKMKRAVSLHSVQAHGVVFEVLQSMWKGHERPSKRQKKRRQSALGAHTDENNADNKIKDDLPFPPRICMHSYSGPPEALKQFLAPSVPTDVYFSFSTAINFGNKSSEKVTNVIKAVPDDRVLIESDLHCAGDWMDDLLRQIVLKVCEIKGWPVKDGAEQLKKNYQKFIFG